MLPYVNATKTYDTVPCFILFFPPADTKHNFKVRDVNPVITLTACSSHTINTSESFWLLKFIACESEVAMHAVMKRYETGLPSSPLAVCLFVGFDYFLYFRIG